MTIQSSKLQISISLGIGTGLIYLAFLAPVIWSPDGNAMLEVAISLVKNQNFRVSETTGALGVDGYYYSMWYPLPSILAVPLVTLGLLISQRFNLPEVYMSGACALVLPPIFTALTTALLVLLAFRLGSDRQGACLAALSFAFGTIAIAYTREFYVEPLLALLTILSVYLVFGRSNISIFGASLSAGLAILAKPSAIILGPLLSIYLFLKKRHWSVAITPLIGSVVFALIYAFYNYIRFGNPLSFGQSWMSNVSSELLTSSVSLGGITLLIGGLLGLSIIYLFLRKRHWSVAITPLIVGIIFILIYAFYNYIRFGSPLSLGQSSMSNVLSESLATNISSREGTSLIGGLLGLLASPGRGVIWYSPCVVLGFVGFRYAHKSKFLEASLIIVFSLLFLVINSGSWWMGGWAWGPRYLLPIFPLLLSLAALLTKRWRLTLITLATIGFLINAPNLVSFYKRYYVNAAEQQIEVYSPQIIWSFEHAPFRQGWSLASEQINDAMQNDLRTVFKSIGKKQLRGALTRIVPVWWWLLPIAGIPQWVGALIALLIAGSGLWMIGTIIIER